MTKVTPNTIPDLLSLRAEEAPNAVAYSYLDHGEFESDRMTYAELEQRSLAVAELLRAYARSGDRVVLIYPSGLEFLTAFFGCLYARIVAVPLHSPRPGRHNDRLAAIIEDADAKVALTTCDLLPKVRQTVNEYASASRPAIVTTDDLDLSQLAETRPETIRAEDLAFLQYTSGSTASPKGVMVSHGNLVANQKMIHQTFRGSKDSIVLGWLPLYHDMGLIGNVLQTLWMGARCVMMSPTSFLHRPARWLEAISKYGATISGGPDFAFRLCTQKISLELAASLDLSRWEVAFNGSEPIRPDTLERFSQRFAPSGFRRNAFVTCYGLAEATLFVSGKPAGEPPALCRYDAGQLRRNGILQDEPGAGEHLLAGSGSVAEELRLEIVDPHSSAPVNLAQVGEIWVSGPSVAQGYWNNDQATEEVFHARMSTSDGPFLRTGDLGFRLGDELFITGRLKDLIIVRGQNHYPQDIEQTAAACDPVLATSIGAAFSHKDDAESSVILVQEVPRQIASSEDLDRLERIIRIRVAEQEGISLDQIALVKFGSIPRTTSGKVRRQACRELFVAGDLDVLNQSTRVGKQVEGSVNRASEDRAAPRLQAMSQLAAEMVRIRPEDVDPAHSLLALGLDSLMMTNLRFQFEERLSLSVSLEGMLGGKSLRELSEEANDIPSDQSRNEARTLLLSAPAIEKFSLSMGQKAIWFLHLLSPESPAYNLFSASRFSKAFDIPALQGSFQRLTEHHSLLRCVIVNTENGPIHHLLQDHEVDFATVNGREWDDDALHKYLRVEANKPFTPSVTPPFRVRVVQQGHRGDVLLVALHHLVADLSSISILLEDLCIAYPALLDGSEPELPLRPHYSSFVASQEQAFNSVQWNRQKEFWLGYLRDAELALASPFDRSSRSRGGNGGTFRFRIGERLASRIKDRATEFNVSLYTYLMAVFQALLLRLTAQDDLLVGSVVSGRTSAAWAHTVGYCVNQIVLRARWNAGWTFLDMLLQTQKDVSKALDHQDYPFSLLTEDYHALYGSRGEPLTRIMFSLQTVIQQIDRELSSFLLGHDGKTLRLGRVELDALEIDNEGAQFDLSLVISEAEAGLLGVLQYRIDLFERGFVETLAAQFELALETVTANPRCPLEEIPLVSEQERMQMRQEWNSTSVPYKSDIGIDELIEDQARSTPAALAVRARDGDLTYGELSASSTRLAKYLRQVGAHEETVIGLHCHRTKNLLVAMLAILKSGAAFLPLDSTLPSERIAYMLEQTDAQIVLSDDAEPGAALQLSTSIHVVKLDDPSAWTSEECFGLEQLPSGSSTERLAYVIFTSGSTGKPKGVMVTHRNVINFFKGMDDQLDFHPGDRFIAVTSISFDISILELLWPLTRGAEVDLVPERGRGGSSLLSINNEVRKPLDFSLFYFADASEQRGPERYRLLLEGAKFADRNGFAAVWTPERHFHRFGGSYPNPSLTGAAIAAITSRVAIRAGSVVLPLHDPIRVAEEWSTIDNLSGGRVGVAFASGWHVDDFVLAPERYASRRQIMLASIERLQQLWRGESVEAVNGNGKTIQVQLYPAPVQAHLPIWITASGTQETFEVAGRIGANLLTHLLGQTLDEVASNIGRYHEALSQNGYDPTTRTVTLMLHTYLGRDRDTVKDRVRIPFREYLRSSLGLVEKLITSLGLPVDLKSLSPKDLDDLLDFAFNRYWDTSGLFGTPDSCRTMVDEIAKIGVTEIACLTDFGVATDLVLESLPLLRDLMQASQSEVPSGIRASSETVRKPRTFLQCTPSMMKILLAEGDDKVLGTIDTLLLGGEPLPGNLVDMVRERYNCRIFNMYGPTETTVWSTMLEMQNGKAPVSVGGPIANTQCYIVDRRGLLVPKNFVGELLIGGEGVARGYWRRADLTNERFIKDSFNVQGESRLYRTGDLARRLPNGHIEILGRTDHQVKIRGFRVEPLEIEFVLCTHDEIQDAVILKRGEGDDVHLTAFYASCSGVPISEDMLRAFLRKTLPEYMIPSEFVHIEKIPLMSSGKADRKQLEALEVKSRPAPVTDNQAALLPAGHLESHVLEIWKKVLNLDAVGLDDNFFDLGGHSLLMVQVHSELTSSYSYRLPLIKLLENPTIRSLAKALSTGEEGAVSNEEIDRAAQRRKALKHFRVLAATASKDVQV